MFSTGNKEVIVNRDGQYNVVTAPAALGDVVKIHNFGEFDFQGIVNAGGPVDGFLFKPESLGSGDLTCPSAAAIGLAATDVRVPVTFLIRINTSRYSSEWATDFIKRGRPLVVELNLDGGDTAGVVADKLLAAFEAYENAFGVSDNSNGSLPFNFVQAGGPGTALLTLTLKSGDLSFQESVTFLKKWDTYGLVLTPTSGWVAGPAGFGGAEADVDGKYLEENVQMSTAYNDGAYTIKPGERPIIASPYMTLTWVAPVPTDGQTGWDIHPNLATSAPNAGAGYQSAKFTMYFNADYFTDNGGLVGFVPNGDLATLLTAIQTASGVAVSWT
jgi:hypothetical protein